LEEKICRTLSRIGFQDVADKMRVDPPLIHLSLRDLARQSEGMELHFMQLLDLRVCELNRLGARKLSLTEVRAAIKDLRSVKNWTPHCELLAQQILSLVERRLGDGTARSIEIRMEAA
jgi:hypothetical protein